MRLDIVVAQRVTQVIALRLLSERPHETRPLQRSQRRNVEVCRGNSLPRLLFIYGSKCVIVPTNGQVLRVWVRVVRTRKRRPGVHHALHEGKIEVVSVRKRAGKASKYVV